MCRRNDSDRTSMQRTIWARGGSRRSRPHCTAAPRRASRPQLAAGRRLRTLRPRSGLCGPRERRQPAEHRCRHQRRSAPICSGVSPRAAPAERAARLARTPPARALIAPHRYRALRPTVLVGPGVPVDASAVTLAWDTPGVLAHPVGQLDSHRQRMARYWTGVAGCPAWPG